MWLNLLWVVNRFNVPFAKKAFVNRVLSAILIFNSYHKIINGHNFQFVAGFKFNDLPNLNFHVIAV